MTSLTRRTRADIARPLKVLVPLIKRELELGEHAGLEHYCRAGEMLNEAKAQMPYGNFGGWLAKNFTLSSKTAYRYMRLADIPPEELSHVTKVTHDYASILGERTPRQQVHGSWSAAVKSAKALDAELFAQERQTEDEEIRIRRELVGELIDIGYKALATRLHPDRGGSKDAMTRLNDIRAQLTQLAKTRRWL
jgi:hypothetical protein